MEWRALSFLFLLGSLLLAEVAVHSEGRFGGESLNETVAGKGNINMRGQVLFPHAPGKQWSIGR